MHTAEAGGPIKQGPRLQDLTAPPERLDCIGGPWGAVDGAWRESARSDCHVREQRMGEGQINCLAPATLGRHRTYIENFCGMLAAQLLGIL